MGILKATGEYLLIINDDSILDPRAIELHYKKQIENKNKKVAVLGRNFLSPLNFQIIQVLGYILEHTDVLFYYNRMKDGGLYDFNHFYTCNISIRRDAVVNVGLFDEDFTGPAAEDLELGFRLAQKGYQVLFASEILAWHDHITSFEGLLKTHKVRSCNTHGETARCTVL